MYADGVSMATLRSKVAFNSYFALSTKSGPVILSTNNRRNRLTLRHSFPTLQDRSALTE